MAICALGFGPGFSGGSGGGSGSVALAGAWDASAGTFPGSGAATKGTQYRVSVAGTVNGVAFDVGDTLEAIVDNASATTYAGNWIIGQGVITAVDISDSTSLGRSILTAANATAAVAAIGILTLANIFTAAQTIRIDSLGATATTASAGIGSYLRNTTAAAAGAQQYSPRSVWEGQGWKTTATAASQAVAFMAETRPVQGTTAPTGTWALAASINGGAYSDVLKVDSVGNLVLSTGKYIWPTTNYINFGNSASSASFTFYTGNSQFVIGSSGSISWTNSGDSYAGTQDLYIYRDVANTLALRNSTSAQTFRAYNTFTDSSNGEWGTFDFSQSANVLSIGTMANGTGTARNLRFVIGGTSKADWGITYANCWYFSPIAATILRVTNINNESNGVTAFTFATGSTTSAQFYPGSTNPLMQFGGTTSSFPALKRSTTDIQVRLADDSGYAGLQLGTASSALKVGTHSAIAAETVTGYITIKDSAGTDRKIAVVS